MQTQIMEVLDKLGLDDQGFTDEYRVLISFMQSRKCLSKLSRLLVTILVFMRLPSLVPRPFLPSALLEKTRPGNEARDCREQALAHKTCQLLVLGIVPGKIE